MKTKNSIHKKIAALVLTMLFAITAFPQPVSWTATYDASHQFTLDNATGAKTIAYNPANSDIYVFGQRYFYLPGNPGPAQTREFGVVRFDRLTGVNVDEVFPNHFTLTQTETYNDVPGEMVIASDGSVYVTGSYFFDNVSGYDAIVIKYNAALTEQWRYYFKGTGTSNDLGITITLDPSENICVAGQIGNDGTSTGINAGLAKLSPAGTLLWQKILATAGTELDVPTDVMTDNSGNIYATGYTLSATLGNQYALVKFNSSGTVLWKRKYNQVTTVALDDKSNSVAVDNISGNVYITGTSENAAGNSDIVTVCYSSAGTKLWTKKINNPGSSRDHGIKVIVDAAQNVFVGGDVDKDPAASVVSNGDLIVRKYNASGTALLTINYNGAGYNCSFGDFAVASSGSIYIISSCVGAVPPPASNTSSLMTVQFNSSAVFQWVDLISTPQFISCGEGYFGWKLAVNSFTSEIVVGGRHFVDCPGANTEEWQLRRYNPTLREASTISESENGLQIKLFPNPVENIFHLSLNFKDGEKYYADVFDFKGQLIKTFIITSANSDLDISSWSKGIYFLRIGRNDEIIFSKKFIH